LYAGPKLAGNILTNLTPNPARLEKLDQIYNWNSYINSFLLTFHCEQKHLFINKFRKVFTRVKGFLRLSSFALCEVIQLAVKVDKSRWSNFITWIFFQPK